MKTEQELVLNYSPGDMTKPELLKYLAKNLNLSKRGRRELVDKLQKLTTGLRLYRKVRSARNGAMSKVIPQEPDWRELFLLSPKEQAKWYKAHCPEVGTPEYNLFKRLCKAFNLGGNEFYYWLRKLK